ncbi:MAG: HPr family phosphocarrier protein [Magnetovibrionaceae bacterium]
MPEVETDSRDEAGTGDALAADALISNQRGLHARAASKFVSLAETFSADIQVTKAGQTVSGRSILGLMMLAAGPGCTIHIEATGEDADAALGAITKLIADKFDED